MWYVMCPPGLKSHGKLKGIRRSMNMEDTVRTNAMQWLLCACVCVCVHMYVCMCMCVWVCITLRGPILQSWLWLNGREVNLNALFNLPSATLLIQPWLWNGGNGLMLPCENEWLSHFHGDRMIRNPARLSMWVCHQRDSEVVLRFKIMDYRNILQAVMCSVTLMHDVTMFYVHRLQYLSVH